MLTQAQKWGTASLVSLVAASWLLVGCGDSDSGGGSGDSAESLVSEKVAITEENAAEVTAAAIGGDIDSAMDDMPIALSGTTPLADSLSSPLSVARFIDGLNQKNRVSASKTVTASETAQCTDGGSATVVDNGDSGSISFSNCASGGVTMNGSMSISLLDWDGYDDAFSYSANFSMTSGSDSVSMKGSFKMGIYDGYTGDKVKIADMSLLVKATEGSNSYSFAAVDYNDIYDSTVTPDTEVWSGDFGIKVVENGTTEQLAANIDGSVEDLNNYANNDYPGAGTVTITGAGGSKVTVTYDSAAGDQVVVMLDDTTELFAGTYDEFDTWLDAQ